MRRCDRWVDAEILTAAAIRATMEARWEIADLLTRHPEKTALDLLRGRAAELAGSANGHDQITAVALEAAADDLESDHPPLGSGASFVHRRPADPDQRRRTQREVMSMFGAAEADADALVTELESYCRREAKGIGGFAEVANGLLDTARLHKQLWDDPRIPAEPYVRLTMVCSIPRLIDRAHSIDPLRLGSVRRIAERMRGRRGEAEVAP